MATSLRFAACNEIFQKLSFPEGCAGLQKAGYTGIEIAPFTLGADPVALSPDERDAIRQTIIRHKLSFVGLHWILAAPADLHATTPDKERRERTWRFLDALIDLAADLNPQRDSASVLVFGSPKQRASLPGATPGEASAILRDGLAKLASHAEARHVQILLEPLSRAQCDVVNTLAEAAVIIEEINSPAVQTMFDVHNAVDESLPHTELLRKFWPHIRHIHVNEMDGSEPGQGDYDFGELLTTLEQLNYRGWVSLEAFDFSRDPHQIAAGALEHLLQSQTL
ncbi:MAG TPA: sugar phosphate isomerase/epimerase family protein [Bryobacteraceae bacterium]|jgi:sugar phosphate isomerase/epimerase